MAQGNSSTLDCLEIGPRRALHAHKCILGEVIDERPLAGVVGVDVFGVISTEMEVDKSHGGIGCGDDEDAKTECQLWKNLRKRTPKLTLDRGYLGLLSR